ncbi:hypothetical protein [Saccharothrix algeriensis]|uniref:Uncharacterized protein n=1 Tax=Saccharothrix algeriensis TaxID=173560 RepID=A0A8T8HR96_9PSEU|nr:hypothetical protein [Saccharothrix algeriensis]MBM7812324.1 hypothetical protein [Saccharothrix algeriensis]QTR01098.1 hypothetical protein J7S33_16410 [Saccharothrix algeriensis]
MGTWQPRDEHESAAGWRLWLALSGRLWPDGSWDGTPAAAVAGLRGIASACAEIRSACPGDAPVLRLVDSVVFVVSLPLELWRDDHVPVDADRAALLHGDLAGVVEHAAGVRAVLASGGGWAELEAR